MFGGRKALVSAATGVLTVTLLAGCGVLGSDGAGSGRDAGSGSAAGETDQKGGSKDSDGGKAGSPGSAEAVGTADVSKALATVETTVDGQPLEIFLLDASVRGELLRVELGYRPGGSFEGEYGGSFNAYQLGGSSSPSPYLVDPVNLKKYSVVEAGGLRMETNSIHAKAEVGDVLVNTHYFAAPPADVESLQLSFGSAPWPGFEIKPAR